MHLSRTVNKFHNILSNVFQFFPIFSILYKFHIRHFTNIHPHPFLQFFRRFFLAQTYVNFSKIIDHLLRYDISNNYLNVPTSIQ